MRLLTIMGGCLMLLLTTGGLPAQPLPFQPQHFHQLRFAHRGGYAYGPENTLHTIVQNIRQRGITAMEIDIRMTADGYLVLFHDETVGRLLCTDHDRPLRDMTLAELKQIPLRDSSQGRMYVTEFGELVDTLKQVVFRERRPFLLELDFKPHGHDAPPAVRQLMDGAHSVAKQVGDTLYRYFFVSTFYPEVLKAIRTYDAPVACAFAANRDATEQPILARLAFMLAPMFVRRHHCAIIEPNHCRATEAYVRRWKRRGILINAYTANSPCEKAALEARGIAYTTNCPGQTCDDDPTDQTGKKKGWCKDCVGK